MLYHLLLTSFVLAMSNAAASPSIQATIASHEQAIAQDSKNPHLHYAFGSYLASLDSPDYYQKAWLHLNQAVTLDPSNLNWLFEYGTFCCRIGTIQDSLSAYQTLLTSHPALISVIYNSGFTFKIAGYNDLAIAIYRKILSINPEHESAHLGLAFALLSSGDYKAGWHEHEWNLKKQNKYAPELRALIATNNIAGKKLLLLPEGGLGDTINFIRYAQRLHHGAA